MTRKRALRRMKIKAALAAAWEFVKGYGWQQPITREAVAQILYNAFESAGMLDAIPDKK